MNLERLNDAVFTKSYPPEVRAYRERLLAIIDDCHEEAQAKAQRIRSGRYLIEDTKRVIAEVHEQIKPLNDELAHLEMFSTTTITMRRGGS